MTTFNKLSNRAQYARKSWHIKVARKYATKLKSLIQMAKEYGCIIYYWGVHTHLSEVTNLKFTLSEAKRQVEVA